MAEFWSARSEKDRRWTRRRLMEEDRWEGFMDRLREAEGDRAEGKSNGTVLQKALADTWYGLLAEYPPIEGVEVPDAGDILVIKPKKNKFRQYTDNGERYDVKGESEPDPEWPFQWPEHNESQWINSSKAKQAEWGVVLGWVMSSINNDTIKPQDAPSNQAWAMLRWVKEGPKEKHAFITGPYAAHMKRLDAEKNSDNAKTEAKVFRLLDQFEALENCPSCGCNLETGEGSDAD